MIIDTETTGLDPKRNGIIQIAMQPVIWRQDDLPAACGEPAVFHVAPFSSDAVEPKALEVSGHTAEEIRAYPEPMIVFRQVEAFLKDCGVDQFNPKDKYGFVAYNAPFDAEFVRAWFGKCGSRYYGSWFWTPAIDAMGLAMVELLHERPILPNFRLTTVAEHLGVACGKAHDAAGDVKTTLGLLRAIVERQQARRAPRVSAAAAPLPGEPGQSCDGQGIFARPSRDAVTPVAP